MNAQQIIERLHARFPSQEWIAVEELRETAGANSCRSIDFAAVHKWPSKGHRFVCIEVKVSKSDWRQEIDTPEKRAPFETRAHEFWFAAPKGIIPVEELPDGCGLLETHGTQLRKTRAAVFRRNAPGPTTSMMIMLMRALDQRANEHAQRYAQFAEFAGRSISLDDLRRLTEKFGLRNEHHIRYQIENELRAARRAQNLQYAEWARTEREWKQLLRYHFDVDEPTPEDSHKAMELLRSAASLRRLASTIIDNLN